MNHNFNGLQTPIHPFLNWVTPSNLEVITTQLS